MTELITREDIERGERECLASYACHSAESAGRKYAEVGDPHPYRTCYQRDIGRVIHSFSFRRLQLKTQVFVTHEGDFYRTRLTHSYAVAHLGDVLARTLRLNADLIQAISLAHDLGHPPFGHAGEEELQELMRDHGGFEHNINTLDIVDRFESYSPLHPGLNLTFETREGITRHATEFDVVTPTEEFSSHPQPSLEAQVVNVADVVTFRTHDLEDALWLGLISETEMNEAGLTLWDRCREEALHDIPREQRSTVKQRRRLIVRRLIDTMMRDIASQTRTNVLEAGVATVEDVRQQQRALVDFSAEVGEQSRQLGRYLFEQVYSHPTVMKMVWKGRLVVRRLFEAFVDEPKLLPSDFQRQAEQEGLYQAVCRYIAGMTDRYATDQYQILFDPTVRAGIDPTRVE